MEKLWYNGKNYGTMKKKTMVLWKKQWYYTENYGTLLYYEKKLSWYLTENYGTLIYYWKKNLWYYTEIYGTLVYHEKNHGAILKTIELWFTIKNYGTMGKKTMDLWTNYGTILRNMELRFTKEENIVDYKKLRNFDL